MAAYLPSLASTRFSGLTICEDPPHFLIGKLPSSEPVLGSKISLFGEDDEDDTDNVDNDEDDDEKEPSGDESLLPSDVKMQLIPMTKEGIAANDARKVVGSERMLAIYKSIVTVNDLSSALRSCAWEVQSIEDEKLFELRVIEHDKREIECNVPHENGRTGWKTLKIEKPSEIRDEWKAVFAAIRTCPTLKPDIKKPQSYVNVKAELMTVEHENLIAAENALWDAIQSLDISDLIQAYDSQIKSMTSVFEDAAEGPPPEDDAAQQPNTKKARV